MSRGGPPIPEACKSLRNYNKLNVTLRSRDKAPGDKTGYLWNLSIADDRNREFATAVLDSRRVCTVTNPNDPSDVYFTTYVNDTLSREKEMGQVKSADGKDIYYLNTESSCCMFYHLTARGRNGEELGYFGKKSGLTICLYTLLLVFLVLTLFGFFIAMCFWACCSE